MTPIAETLALALRCHQAGNLTEAVAHYRQALDLDPNHAQAHNNLGNALFQLGKRDEAVDHYRQALRLRLNYAQAHSNLANALRLEGRAEEAAAHCRQALSSRPDFLEAHVNLGIALLDQRKFDAAIDCFLHALRINPQSAEAHCNLGNAFERQDKLDEAIRCYEHALQLKPDFAEARNNAGCALLRQGQVDLALASFRQTLRLQPDFAAAQSNLMSCSNYDPEADPDAVFAEHCRWGQAQESGVRNQESGIRSQESGVRNQAAQLPHANDPTVERRLRIGYVSPDLRQHALMRYFEPVLAHHDPRQVEILGYAEVPSPDAVTKRLQDLAHGWRWTCRLSDAQVAEQIRSDRIDILVDLAGHTANNRLGVFAHKPAPIQVTWLGYMNTTGLTAIDYRLTDAGLDPPGQPVRDTEQLMRLPGGVCCFAAPADAPPVGPLPALDRGHVTFGSLANLFKLNGQVFDLWSRVLQAVPSARLLLFRGTLTNTAQEHIRGQFTERGIASERLDLRRGSCAPGYLGIYGEIDVSLDTFPCTGGVTTCESLWMGAPVLSLRGVRPAARNSAALLARVGLDDWAVDTPQQYVAWAVRWASDVDRLATLRSELRDRAAAALCDAPHFTRTLEDAYRTMWRQWCGQRASRSRNPKS